MLLLLAGACSPASDPPVHAPMGDPLPGLAAPDRERFERGRALFARIFTPGEGLGPRFNENSCSACHTFPVDGGTGETAVTKATRHSGAEACDLLTPGGGENVRIQVTPAARAAGVEPLPAPEDAEHRARFTIPFLFGLGLVDAIPLRTLETLADPEDEDGDGISGRIGRNRDGAPARFGRKADVASLRDFTDSALRLEMGLTTPDHPDETEAGGSPDVPPEVDPAPDPEVTEEEVEALTDFVRYLAPPSPAESTDPLVERGELLFSALGCTDCHVPRLRAGDDASAAVAGRSVALFSDLLLHDMGSSLAGTCSSEASVYEYRTEPLMGLRYRETYLHDGRAGRVVDAILFHGGEALAARDRFASLDRLTQEALLRYLNTL